MIECNTTDWPIIRMHFTSNPTYEDSITWLKECDRILSQSRQFVVVSTFEPNYQFVHQARKQQSFWFKSVKQQLGQFCLGMVRVTTDEVMIKKIKSPSMKRTMPFECEVKESLNQAIAWAEQVLAEKRLA